MERIDLATYKKDNNNFSEKKFLSCNNQINGTFTIENGEYDILFANLKSNEKMHLEIKDSADVRMSFFAKNELENMDVIIDVYESSSVEIYFADFSFGMNNINFLINLKNPFAKANFHLASLTSREDKKVFNISVAHEAKNTSAKVDNYGVCKDASKLLFAGTSSINKGCVESSTYQSAKIMVFD